MVYNFFRRWNKCSHKNIRFIGKIPASIFNAWMYFRDTCLFLSSKIFFNKSASFKKRKSIQYLRNLGPFQPLVWICSYLSSIQFRNIVLWKEIELKGVLFHNKREVISKIGMCTVMNNSWKRKQLETLENKIKKSRNKVLRQKLETSAPQFLNDDLPSVNNGAVHVKEGVWWH